MTTEDQPQPPIFTEEGIRRVSAFLSELKRIHIRLLIEGYRIVDGRLVHLDGTIKPSHNQKAKS